MDKAIVYSTPTCPFCVRAKRYLSDRGVEYEDADVSKDREKLKEMVKKTGQMGVPVIEINGKVIIGFNRYKIDDEIAKMKVS